MNSPFATMDWSYFPQEDTAARLPTASQTKLCEPCKALLRGDRMVYIDDWEDTVSRPRYVHHVDAKSFRKALELRCDICIRLYKALKRPWGGMIRPYDIAPTNYKLDTFLQDPTRIRFESEYHITASASIEAYESRPDLHFPHVTRNTGEDEAIEWLLEQHRRCRELHAKCQHLAPYNDFMPTRVLHVGSAEDQAVQLCEGANAEARAGYTVLSHCWGALQQRTVLTKSTVDMFKEGIPWSLLSRTFQDAITVTRKFQIQYIWIDSLCIFQDDLSDWASEAACMRDVYSKAEFCIAATAAPSGDYGLFFDRDIQELTPVTVDATWPDTKDSSEWPTPGQYLLGFHTIMPRDIIDRSPLNERAWVAQERFLSPRILHFTHALLFWECCTAFTSESSTKTNVSPGFITPWFDPNTLKRLLYDVRSPVSAVKTDLDRMFTTSSNDSISTSDQVYRLWCQFLRRYSGYELTKESDVLVALTGIAEEVGQVLNDRLVAGLWESRIVEDMCWEPIQLSRSSTEWRAPTWSWASTIDCVYPISLLRPANFSPPEELAAVRDIRMLTTHIGEMGLLFMECRLIPASVRYSEENELAWCTMNRGIWPPLVDVLIDEERPELFEVHIDDTEKECYCDQNVVDVQLLVLLRYDGSDDDPVGMLAGICIVNFVNTPDVCSFKRVGSFCLFGKRPNKGSVLSAYEQAAVRNILLV